MTLYIHEPLIRAPLLYIHEPLIRAPSSRRVVHMIRAPFRRTIPCRGYIMSYFYTPGSLEDGLQY
jgi:hypothetical protein